jgi:outer membrane biosynthesis protein TonB
MQDAPRFGALDEHDARFMMDRQPVPERSSASRATRFLAFALTLAVLFGVVVHYWPGPSEPRILASGMQEAPARPAAPQVVPAAPPARAPLPVAQVTREPTTAPATSEPSSAATQVVAAPPPAPAPAPAGEATKEPATAPAAPASISEPQPGGTAKLVIAVSPRGELYIDGKHYGTTPPITRLDLEPGMHRIEIRSGSRKPYLTYMAVQAGEERRIRHDFGARPSRPPI